MGMPGEVWVFAEKSGLAVELLGQARRLGERVAAVVVGARSAAEDALRWGAGRVFWLGEIPQGALLEDISPALIRLVKEHRPRLVLIGASKRGRVIAGRLAARLDTSVVTDVLAFSQEGESLAARHLIFGGGAVRVEKPLSPTVVATTGAGVFEPAEPGTSEGEIIPVTWEGNGRAKLRERRVRAATAVNLQAAKKVVCPGRGVAKKEDLGLIEEVARLLGAEIGCTRPLAEGLDWLPRERYIGVSGAQIKPQLYLGVGVSGQVQHMIGMNGARVVAAINKDKNAPIFQNADYGVVGDLYQVLPAVIAALKARR